MNLVTILGEFMKIKKRQLFDLLIYAFFALFLIFDLFWCLDINGNSYFVIASFIPVLGLCTVAFVKSHGFLTIDQMLYVFVFVFCYYTPLHQYVENTNIHDFSKYSDVDYLLANFIVLLFLGIYLIIRKYGKRTIKFDTFKLEIRVSTNSLCILCLISIASIIWLQQNHALFSLTDTSDYNAGDSLSIVIVKIVRFFPISALLLSLMSIKDKTITGNRKLNAILLVIICTICVIIFFPINGTLSRYLLFGTYLMVLHTLFERNLHKSMIVLAAFIGFALIFLAFNFFKYNSFLNISEFTLGGFDASFIDYDAYQMLMQSFHYVSDYGLLWGMNILTALGCVIPRSIWLGKFDPTGALLADSYGASFNNLSCPIFAEFYLAFGILGVVTFSILFAKLINLIESVNRTRNPFFRALYSISVGMIIPFARGALLPMTSFWVCLVISLVMCSFICVICTNSKKVYPN